MFGGSSYPIVIIAYGSCALCTAVAIHSLVNLEGPLTQWNLRQYESSNEAVTSRYQSPAIEADSVPNVRTYTWPLAIEPKD